MATIVTSSLVSQVICSRRGPVIWWKRCVAAEKTGGFASISDPKRHVLVVSKRKKGGGALLFFVFLLSLIHLDIELSKKKRRHWDCHSPNRLDAESDLDIELSGCWDVHCYSTPFWDAWCLDPARHEFGGHPPAVVAPPMSHPPTGSWTPRPRSLGWEPFCRLVYVGYCGGLLVRLMA